MGALKIKSEIESVPKYQTIFLVKRSYSQNALILLFGKLYPKILILKHLLNKKLQIYWLLSEMKLNQAQIKVVNKPMTTDCLW